MVTARKLVPIGVSLLLGVGLLGTAEANAGNSEQRLHRYIDAGGGGAASAVAKHVWEPQVGFTGGKAESIDGLRGKGLHPAVAESVLTGASAFAIDIPNGQYRVTVWSVATHDPVTIVVEGKATKGKKGKRIQSNTGQLPKPVLKKTTFPAHVVDGSLNFLLSPAQNKFQIAAVAITGEVAAAPSTTTSTSVAPTTTVRPTTSTTVRPTTSTTSTTVRPTTTSSTTSVKPVSQKCTNPEFTTSDPNGGWENGGYYVHNNMWNAGASDKETLYACSYKNWYVTANMGGSDPTSVKTYPNVHKDYDNVPIRSFNKLTSTFAATSPHKGIYNVGYDIWTNGVATDGSTEFMIWTENYNQRPAGDIVETVTLGGKTYDVWKTSDSHYIAYVPKKVMTSGSVDLMGFFNHAISKGWLAENSTIGQIDYGVEICSTAGQTLTFNFTDFSITEG